MGWYSRSVTGISQLPASALSFRFIVRTVQSLQVGFFSSKGQRKDGTCIFQCLPALLLALFPSFCLQYSRTICSMVFFPSMRDNIRDTIGSDLNDRANIELYFDWWRMRNCLDFVLYSFLKPSFMDKDIFRQEVYDIVAAIPPGCVDVRANSLPDR